MKYVNEKSISIQTVLFRLKTKTPPTTRKKENHKCMFRDSTSSRRNPDAIRILRLDLTAKVCQCQYPSHGFPESGKRGSSDGKRAWQLRNIDDFGCYISFIHFKTFDSHGQRESTWSISIFIWKLFSLRHWSVWILAFHA